MKKSLCLMAAMSLATLPWTVLAGSYLDSYWPLNGGDQKTFVYDGGLPLTLSVTDDGDNGQGETQFEISEAYQGKTVTLVVADDADHSYFIGVPGYIHVSFDPQVLLLDENLLQNGGTVKTSTTVHQTGISYPATFTIKVAKAGSITVVGGTFADCRSITATEVAHVRGQTISASALTAFLAPGVGIIKTLVSPGHWAELVTGTVAGVPVGRGNLSPIAVAVSGGGSVTPDYNGQLLYVGHDYTMTANPTRGNIFAYWSDGSYNIVGTAPKLAFTMQNNLVLQANFMPNPFTLPAGVYTGLFSPAGGATAQDSGVFTLTVTSKGAFSGYLKTGATRHPISGQFDYNGNFTGNVSIPKQNPWTITLNLDLSGGNVINGTINGGTWTATLTGNKTVHKAADTPVAQAGRYTMLFARAGGPPTLPESYATVDINEAGAITLAGSLPDGSKMTQSTTLSHSAQWPFYASLDHGAGCLFGWVNLDDSGNISGNLLWITPAGSSGNDPGGFKFLTPVSGGHTVIPAP